MKFENIMLAFLYLLMVIYTYANFRKGEFMDVAVGVFCILAFYITYSMLNKTGVPQELFLIIALLIVYHLGGVLIDAYGGLFWYDDIAHFLTPFFIGVLVLVILNGQKSIQFVKHRKLVMMLLAISITLALCTLWELWEFASDTFFNTTAQDHLFDTMCDLLLGLIGAISASIAGWPYLKLLEARRTINKS